MSYPSHPYLASGLIPGPGNAGTPAYYGFEIVPLPPQGGSSWLSRQVQMQSKSFPSSFRQFFLFVFVLCGVVSTALVACGGSEAVVCQTEPCTPVPPAEFLYATSHNGQVLSLPVDLATGAVGAATCVAGPAVSLSMAAVGSQLVYASDGQTVLDSHPVGIAVDSTGQFVYVALNATNQVAAFSIARGTGALASVPGSPFSAGNLPFPMAATGKFLYVSNAGDGAASGYSIDALSGVLTPLPGSPFAIPAPSLVADPTGKYLYGGGAGILAFAINRDGSLTPVSGSPFPAPAPLVLTIVQMPSGA